MIELYFDGGSKGNPGVAAYGFVIYDNGNLLHEEGKRLPKPATNNIAEYIGVCNGLMWISRNISKLKDKNLIIKGDSQLVCRQLLGEYQVKAANLKKYYNIAIELITYLEKEGWNVTIEWVAREFNNRADKLLNIAIVRG